MVNRERQKVSVESTSVSIEYSSVDSAIETLQFYKKTYGGNAYIKPVQYDYSEGSYLGIFIEVDETDKQMEYRIKNEEKWEKEQIDRDIKQLKILQEKYNDKI